MMPSHAAAAAAALMNADNIRNIRQIMQADRRIIRGLKKDCLVDARANPFGEQPQIDLTVLASLAQEMDKTLRLCRNALLTAEDALIGADVALNGELAIIGDALEAANSALAPFRIVRRARETEAGARAEATP
jgi:hypothetical protein